VSTYLGSDTCLDAAMGQSFDIKPCDQQANEAAKDNFCDLMETMLHAAQL